MKAVVALAAALVLASLPASAGPTDAGLPLVERPAAGPGDTMAVLYSGDGGWAAVDDGVAERLQQAHVPVVGIDSLRYFWNGRTADAAAADLSQVMETHAKAWRRPRVLLIGYSFGAGALPAIVARLPAAERRRIRAMILVSARERGELQFHMSSWANQPAADAYPIAPLLARLQNVPTACIYGDRDSADACPDLTVARHVRLAGGHHFDGDYATLGRAILTSAGL